MSFTAPNSPKSARPTDFRRASVLMALCLAGFAVTLTYTGIGVVVPAIQNDFHASSITANWIINAFVLAFGAFVMAAGTLADRYGRRRVMVFGVFIFTASSFAGALAPGIVFLDLMRAAQGIGAALTMAAAAAAVANVFRERDQVRAFALLGTCFGIGFALGPILIGLSVGRFGWRAVFAMSALLGVLVMLAMYLSSMPESRDPGATRFDWAGTLAFSLMLVLFTDGLMEASTLGWTDLLPVFLLISAAAMLVVFIVIERRQRRPMLDLSLFAYPRFVGVQSLPVAAGFGFIAPLAILPIRLVGAEGMSEAQAGLALLPLCLPMTVVPLLSGYLTRWIGPGVLCAAGLALSAYGLFSLAGIPAGGAASAFTAPLLAIGIGVSLPWGLMDALAVSVVPKERAGMAVGIFGTMRLISEGSAIAITIAVLTSSIRMNLPHVAAAGEAANRLAAGRFHEAMLRMPGLRIEQLEASYNHAFHVTFLVLAVITGVAAFIAFVTVRHPSPETEVPVLESSCEALVGCGGEQ
ncbi:MULTISPECIES: MFS transporter [Paraburkholderia]|uniref:MFS transporter n=1 Tax=Paraburkholderia TaxID=1822464 RepID=UPI002257FA5C|nr:MULTISPECIES: MFS transporter [Paraburkholderia]MCX4163654.1 MFS transporter [Paraburkholderia megapolitana]MDN7159149.1 MFS transporter [Paraburkholderia sp. CHISQ3]MDQ6496196.1 MFS transporter [Paraburkholderia megapolitana]